MDYKIWFLAIVFLLSSGNAMAQINESDTVKFQLRASFTGNYQQGNVEVLNVRGRLDFLVAPHKNWVFKSQNSSLYQAFYSQKADNDLFSRNYLYFKPQHKVYPFAIAYVSSNFRRKIVSRYFVGAGVTWQAIKTKAVVIKFSASAVQESTTFSNVFYNYPAYNGIRKISLWRGTLYTGGWTYLLDRRARIFYDAFWQPGFAHPNNYRTQFDIGLDFPVWKGLAFNIFYTFTHENVVVRPVQQNDRILTFGLAYNLKRTAFKWAR